MVKDETGDKVYKTMMKCNDETVSVLYDVHFLKSDYFNCLVYFTKSGPSEVIWGKCNFEIKNYDISHQMYMTKSID